MMNTSPSSSESPPYSKLQELEKDESLLSETSLRASLAPPRAPPYYTANRSLYAKKDPSGEGMALHHRHNHRHHNRSQGLYPPKKYHLKNLHDKLTKIHLGNYHHKHARATSPRLSLIHHHHPHLSFSPESPDQITRYISSHILPLGMQNKLRDNGTFRSLSDTAVTCSVPCLGITNPKAAMNFISLSKTIVQINYGFGHPSQKIDLFLPPLSESSNCTSGSDCDNVNGNGVKGLIFFVVSSSMFVSIDCSFINRLICANYRTASYILNHHQIYNPSKTNNCLKHGGAWGSGSAWMYRLVALPFIKANIAVAIVGYRTYPDGNVQDQVDDLYSAAQTLQMKYPLLWKCRCSERNTSKKTYTNKQKQWNGKEEMFHDDILPSCGVCLMGHSSGAHISMLFMVQQVEKKIMNLISGSGDRGNDNIISFDSFVGLSGVYNIQHHFDYEAGRGVEEISPMKPACGYTREAFDHYSPAMKLYKLMKIHDDQAKICADSIMSELIPPMLLLHGMDDETVPFTSTSEAARVIRSCGVQYLSEYYLSETGHADVIMHFMLGGRSKDAVIRWLMEEILHGKKQATSGLFSKL